MTSIAAADWKALKPTIDPASVSVTIASPPVVKFTVKDQNGNPVVGLGAKSQSSTATIAALQNLNFTLAKLVPGTNGAPSKWVNYVMYRPPTVAEKTATPATSSCDAATGATWCGTFPAADTQGTLVDNGDGSYQYTFYRDITKAATIMATLIDSADGLYKKADAGDLSYNATLTHRLGIIITGSQPGTGSNTPNAVADPAKPAVPLVNTFNLGFDFVPAGGTPAVTRDIVTKASCSSCHDGKGIGHWSTTSSPGDTVGRNDPRLCVTCHTDQIKYSFNAGEAPMNADGITFTGPAATDTTTAMKRAKYAVVDGRAVGNFPNLIHKMHMGEDLIKQGYNFNFAVEGLFNEKRFPQSPANCTKCHAGSTTAATGTAVSTTDGDNWKKVPSRLACGACHDGINFATGAGTTAAGAKTGHIGGAKADDSLCVLCHDSTTIPIYHRATVPSPNNLTVQDGVAKFTYDISGVTVVNGNAVFKFKILKDGAAVTSFAVPTTKTNNVASATGTSGDLQIDPAYQPISGFVGGPNFYVFFGVPQDGITTPADVNKSYSASLAALLLPSGSPKAGSITGPDASGYFTATLTGDTVGQATSATCLNKSTTSAIAGYCVNPSPLLIPTTAKVVTGVMMGSFTQINLDAHPYTFKSISGTTSVAATGGLTVPAPNKIVTATGYTARRSVVDNAKCNNCHEVLGTHPNFMGPSGVNQTGQAAPYNNVTTCVLCHYTLRTGSGWSYNANTMIHAIHGAGKRSVAYTWKPGFSTIEYPGVLKDCNQCHLPNTVNLSANGGETLAPNLLWTTTATGLHGAASPTDDSPYFSTATNYGNGFSFNAAGAVVSAYTPAGGTLVPQHIVGAGGESIPAQGTTLVSSPMSAACFSCHDTSTAKSHMTSNGGAVYEARSTALLKSESCLVCHGAGKVADVVVVHQ
ncbi:MAG: OmcA/MtrC family decaheme c-type cytochrome [Proteobacteria bacterium]|nr:OmcA/MtrC family decaheme c-type cytochrome [Pseudomonadota bacterium]